MRVVIRYNREFNLNLINQVGGIIIDELKNLPTLVVADIPKDNIDELLKYDEVMGVKKESPSITKPIPTAIADDIDRDSLIDYLETMRAYDYWERGLTGKGVKIGIFGYGIDSNSRAIIAGGIDSTDLANPDYRRLDDGSDHETRIANILSGSMGQYGGETIVGIAPEAELYSLKCITPTEFDINAIAIAMNWAIENELDIISISWSWWHWLTWEDEEYQELLAIENDMWESVRNAGILVVTSMANEDVNLDTIVDDGYLVSVYPYVLEGVVSVTGLGTNNSRTTYGYGSGTDFIAPARSLRIFTTGNSTVSTNGNSYSTPLVVGVFAMYKQAFPNKTWDEIYNDIANSTQPIDGQTGWDMYRGWGLPQPNGEIMSLPTVTFNFVLKRDGEIIYEGTDNSFLDESLQEDTSYTYELITRNGYGDSNPITLSISTPKNVPTPPKSTISFVSTDRISDEPEKDTCLIRFSFDQDIIQWTVNVLGVSHDTGVVADYGIDALKDEIIEAEIHWTDLYREGENKVNIYGQGKDGQWTLWVDDNDDENDDIVLEGYDGGVFTDSIQRKVIDGGEFTDINNGRIIDGGEF